MAQETPFHLYFALRMAQERNFQLSAPPEAQALLDAGHVVLTQSDGLYFTLLVVVDRAAGPLASVDLVGIGASLLRFTGTMNSVKLPVYIQIWEIGDSSAADHARLKALARRPGKEKVAITAFTMNARGEVWSSALLGGRGAGRGTAVAIAREPRRDVTQLRAQPPAARLPDGAPVVSYALCALLTAIFVGQLLVGVGPVGDLLGPDIYTLVAWGGVARPLVEDGQWYRLLTAAFLHGNPLHLLMNGIALVMAGAALERQVGRMWFLALYVIGALGGSLLSIVLNEPGTVSVGASGAIMGLLAAALVSSFRLPHGGERSLVQGNMLRILIPSMLPLATTAGKVDYAGHLGGALAGALAGMILLRIWPRDAVVPRGARVATAVVAAGLGVLALGGAKLAGQFEAVRSDAQLAQVAETLIPTSEFGDGDYDQLIDNSERFEKKYPKDPRSHYFAALRHIRDEDLGKAEASLRRALEDEALIAKIYPDGTALAEMRAKLAIVLVETDRIDEARRVIAPSCELLKKISELSPVREMLCP